MAPSWIITLQAGASPALIPEPRGLMAQYDFFTSRTVEDGRERFRLHLGFFDDLPTAKSVLRVARETCPAAWLVPADHYQGLRRVHKQEPAAVSAADSVPRQTSSQDTVPPQTMPQDVVPREPASRQEEGRTLEAAEVFDLLDGAAGLLAAVLPNVQVDEGGGILEARAAAPVARQAAGPPDHRLAEADALVRDMSRFIVEEWQPEARRPQRPPAERGWFKRFRRGKRPERPQTTAAS